MEKRVTERAQASGGESDKMEILKTRIEVYRDKTSNLVDTLVQSNKAVKVTDFFLSDYYNCLCVCVA